MKLSIAFIAGLAAAAAAATGSLLQQAPARSASLKNPVASDPDAARAGGKLYGRECASCHGFHREGIGKAPALNRPDIQSAAPGSLFWVLRNGSLRRGMPSFAHLPEAQRWQIVSYLAHEGCARTPATKP